MSDYYVWCYHGENPNVFDQVYYGTPSTSNAYEEPSVGCDTSGYEQTYRNPYAEMVEDAFHGGFDQLQHTSSTVDEEPNNEARRFFEMLEMANQPLYEGCQEGHSRLSLASRMMNTKTDYNVPEGCMDSFCDTMREYLPQPNNAPKSYYETKSTMKTFELPYHKIHVCKNYCMLFWGEDKNL